MTGDRDPRTYLQLANEFSDFLDRSADAGMEDWEGKARAEFQARGWDFAIYRDSYYERMIVEFWKKETMQMEFWARFSGFDAETVEILTSTGVEETR